MKRIQESMKEIQQMFLDLALLVEEQDELIDQVQVNVLLPPPLFSRLMTPRTERTAQRPSSEEPLGA